MSIENAEISAAAAEAPDSRIVVRRSVVALAWNYGGTVTSIVAQLTVGVLLARVLGPKEFGLAAVGLIMVGIVGLLTDFGFGSALIQTKDVSEKDYGFIFTVQTIFGMILSLFVWLSSGALAAFFRMPQAASLIAAIALVFTLQAVGQSSAAILRRNLDFKAVQTVNILSYLIGYMLVGLSLAVKGFGAWSLVVAQITQAALVAAGMLILTPMRMKLTFSPDNPRLLSFGGTVLLTNLCNSALTTVDSALVSRFVGPIGLGFYNRVMVLISTPVNSVTNAVQAVLFASCSQARASEIQLRQAYQATCTLLCLICFPVCMSVAAVPSTVVTAIYGAEWSAGSPLMTPLALAIGVGSALSVIGPILTAYGKVMYEFRAQLATLLLMLPTAYFAARQSVVCLAWALLGIYLVRWVFLMIGLNRSIGISFSELVKPFLWPLLSSFVSAAAAYGTDHLMALASPLSRLVVDIVASAIALVSFIFIVRRKIMQAPHGAYLNNFPRLAKFFGSSSR